MEMPGCFVFDNNAFCYQHLDQLFNKVRVAARVGGQLITQTIGKSLELLKDFNHQQLVAMGAEEPLIQAFLDVPWYSPTLQTAFIQALSELEGVADRATVLEQARDMQSEVEARFFVQSVMLLAWFHQTQGPLNRLLSLETRLPLALTADNRIISLLPVDYLFWTEGIAMAARSIRTVAEYLERHPESLLRGKGGK